MKNVYDRAFKKEHAIKGFESCGLFPIDRKKISEDKLKIGAIFRKRKELEVEPELEPEPAPELESELEIDSFITP